MNRLQRLEARLRQPEDLASLALFRVAFGSIVFWEVGRYLAPQHDWVRRYYAEPRYYFSYWPFDFVQPLPLPGMLLVFGVVAVAALGVAAGFHYRVSSGLVALGLCYIFLLDRTRYLNHVYLVCLIAILMALAPAHHLFSLDALRRPGLRSQTAPALWLALLRFQVAVPYVFGGIAKLNADWLRGEPLREWLSYRQDFPILGPRFDEPQMVLAMAYGGLLFDLLVVGLVLSRRTRAFGFALALGFHLMNARLFDIGIFPWMMIVATTIFFEPGWPRDLLATLVGDRDALASFSPHALGQPWASRLLAAGFALGFALGGWLPKTFELPQALIGGSGMLVLVWLLMGAPRGAPRPGPAVSARSLGPWLLAFAAIWVLLQVLLPLRHFVIPGNVHWTEEGHRFAWHMKLRDKDGRVLFRVVDPATGERFTADPADQLTEKQVAKMSTRPDMIVQYARHLDAQFQRHGFGDVAVYADAFASLNGRPEQRLIDPEVDLSAVPYPWFGHAAWILPLVEGVAP